VRFDSPGPGRWPRLLRPGLLIKRWFLLLLAGLVVISLGIGYALVELYRSVQVPDWVALVTLQFLPLLVRAAIFLVTGAGLCLLAFRGLYRSLADVVVPVPGSGARPSLLGMIYAYRQRQNGPRVVCIGGGTGMPTVLRGLKQYTSHITAIVTVGDDGGSSGRLRREHGILPPGDFRNNIVALAEAEPLMGRLFQYRFPPGSPLAGHSFGNLFVLALTGVTGNFEQALRETSRVLAVKGEILPSTPEDVTVCARFADGTEVCGESRVPEAGKPIERIFLKPAHPAAQPEAVRAIIEADLVVLGPGSLYTSVVPNLLVEGVAKALLQTEAYKVYVCNLATQPGETDGFDVDAHVAALVRHLPGQQNPFDAVVANRRPQDAVSPDPEVALVGALEAPAVKPETVVADVARDDLPLRHDPDKLAGVLMELYAERRAAGARGR
jgi:uncharacterized cofD-like protein